MGNLVAYELREDFAGTVTVYDSVEAKKKDEGREVDVFQGGRVALSDGSTFDVGEKLAESDGLIVVETSNDFLTNVLDSYPALKRTAVPEGASPNADLGSLSKAALKQRAAAAELKTSGSKDELVARLQAHRAAVEAGDQEAADNPTPETGGEGA